VGQLLDRQLGLARCDSDKVLPVPAELFEPVPVGSARDQQLAERRGLGAGALEAVAAVG